MFDHWRQRGVAEGAIHQNPCYLFYKRPEPHVSVKYSEEGKWSLNAEPSYLVSLTSKMGPCC